VDVISWTDDRSCRRKYAAARKGELDELLVAVGSNRDGKAFTRLFAYFRPRVQAHLARLGLAPVAAEDATQDVMETIWRKAHLYDARKSGATTWVLQIAGNRCVDLKRRSREFVIAAENFYDIPDPAVSGDEGLDAAQRQERVRVALDSLPQEQFTLVWLAFFEGLSHSVIARRLNLPLGTVKSRLRLAFACLRRLLLDAGVRETCAAG